VRLIVPRLLSLLFALYACGDDDDAVPSEDAGPSVDAGQDASDASAGEDAGAACPPGQLAGADGRCGREADVTIVTADGVELATWVVLPDAVPAGGVPALISRTPYNDSFPGNREWSREVGLRHAERGYAYVSQDVRGRPPSTGVFLPETHEIEDAGRTIDWIVEQPWSSGAVGTIGGSYLGYTALAAAVDHAAVRVVIADDPSNDETTTRPGGTFWTATLTWIQLVETGEFASDEQTVALTNTFDLPAADELMLGHDSDYWNLVAAHEDIAFWPAESLALTGARTCVPTLVVYSRSTGWRDPIDAFEALRRDGCEEHRADVRLVLTPEEHVHHLGYLFEEETPVNALMLDYIDHYLGERDVDVSFVPLVQWADEGEPYQ
jgi:putative CocE/NonD family hydrolase